MASLAGRAPGVRPRHARARPAARATARGRAVIARVACAGIVGMLAWSAGVVRAATILSGAPSPAITLRVLGSPDMARAMRETLADLLSRVGIDIAAEPTGRTVLVDVAVDLSSGSGAPFVELTADRPPVTICRRQLDANASRDVLIETAAQVVYTAVETRARTQGLIAPAAAPLATAAPRARPRSRASRPTDGATFGPRCPRRSARRRTASTWRRLPRRGSSVWIPAARRRRRARPHVGLARRALGPALTGAVEVQRPVAAGDPDTAAHLSTVSVRVIPTVNAFARRWTALQVGPSARVRLSRGDAPAFPDRARRPRRADMGGPTGAPRRARSRPWDRRPGRWRGRSPGTGGLTGGPPAGSTARGFSAVALSAGAFARWSFRIGQHAQLFAAADVERRLSYAESARPNADQGPNGVGTPAGPSTWRSSLLAGVAFTVAGASTFSR